MVLVAPVARKPVASGEAGGSAGAHEARAGIVGLLVRHAVEADGPGAGMGKAGAPNGEAVPLAAEPRVAEVETEKGE